MKRSTKFLSFLNQKRIKGSGRDGMGPFRRGCMSMFECRASDEKVCVVQDAVASERGTRNAYHVITHMPIQSPLVHVSMAEVAPPSFLGMDEGNCQA